MELVSADSFWARPSGRCVGCDGFLYGCVDPGLYFTLAGALPTPDDAERIVRLWAGELEMAPHASLFDATHLVSLEPRSFELAREYLTRSSAALARVLTRQAVVHPSGQIGATVAGYYSVFQPHYPIALFPSQAEALAWLGRGDALPAVGAAVAAWLAHDPLLSKVRELIDADLRAPLALVARHAGVSARALQRGLGLAGTSFRRERIAAQVRRAQRLLLVKERKLMEIALEIGCSSHQVFTDMFRRETGVTPSEWRARHPEES